MSDKQNQGNFDPNVDNGALGNNLAEARLRAMFTLRSPEQIAQQMQTAQEYYAQQEHDEKKAKKEKNQQDADKTIDDYVHA